MDNTEQHASFFGESRALLEKYLREKFLLFRLELVEKVTSAIAGVVSGLIIAVLGIFFVLMLSIMAALWLDQVLNSAFLGFGIVAAFYLLLIILVAVLKAPLLQTPILNAMIRKTFRKTEVEQIEKDTE